MLANQMAGIFNVDITIYNDQMTSISETILSILGLLGIIIYPTTAGASDSTQTLKYDKKNRQPILVICFTFCLW
ncbi:phage holin [Lysinibacillus sp. NPDC097231]|uniref:phage holin n=1 Tax=Lysinibacillus sp. NPDC097231 TaxID=3364142 RepID=UPI0037F18047